MAVKSPTAEHHEHAPSGRVARWVERAVGYRLSGFPAGVHIGMPSGTVTLVIPFDDPITVADKDAPPRPFGSVVAGLATAPAHIHHDGNQPGIQLALRPGAARQLFGCRAGELAERSHELADVLGSGAVHLREQLHEVASWAARFTLVEEWLVGLSASRECQAAPPEVREAWRVIEQSDGAVRIEALAGHVDWSMRRLQEQFGAEFGVSPKAAAKVRRFERAVPLVAAGQLPLTEVALRCGWSDHAHMDRDWRSLAGTAPSRWRAVDVLAGGSRPTDDQP